MCRRRSPRVTTCHTRAHVLDIGFAVDLAILPRAERSFKNLGGIGTCLAAVSEREGTTGTIGELDSRAKAPATSKRGT